MDDLKRETTILIAEDYADTRDLIKSLVVNLGYNVLTASDGHKAVEYAMEMGPDLILMDLSLPLMDGIVATRLIRSLGNGTEVPIVCITAHSSYYQKMALEAGCNEVLTKPVDVTTLESVIAKYLAQQN